MSLRTISLVFLLSVSLGSLASGCGASSRSEEPQTAAEKQRRDAETTGAVDAPAGSRNGWRYTGERDNCFFVVGRRCFKTEAAACTAAKCGKRKCEATGAGPAAVACAK
jgi:hypothetical protein